MQYYINLIHSTFCLISRKLMANVRLLIKKNIGSKKKNQEKYITFLLCQKVDKILIVIAAHREYFVFMIQTINL